MAGARPTERSVRLDPLNGSGRAEVDRDQERREVMAKTNPKQTSSKAAQAASKVLKGKASPAAKSAAGSALAQARPSAKKK